MTRQGTMAMNTKLEELPAAFALTPGSLDECMLQFLTGMLSGSADCATLAGIQATPTIHAAAYNPTEFSLERIVRAFIVVTGGLLLPVLKHTVLTIFELILMPNIFIGTYSACNTARLRI
jgi:hypothetical protein